MGVSRDKEDARELQKEFDNIEKRWIAGEIKIEDSVGKVLPPPKNSGLYRMCYKTGKKYRRQMHKYWFVSKAGNVISLEREGMPIWQRRSGGERDSQYRITKNKDNKLKRDIYISDYMLVALVYGSRIIGKAKSILDKRGLEAIERVQHDRQGNTVLTKKGKKVYAYEGVSCHHIDGYEKDAVNQKKNCNPDRLVIITNRLHSFFDSYVSERKLTFTDVNDYERCLQEALSYFRSEEKKIKKFVKLTDQENMKGKINVFTLTGDKRGNIESYDTFEEASSSSYYNEIKNGYFMREAIRLSGILQALGVEGFFDYPVVVEEKDKRYTGGIRHDFKIFRYQKGKLPIDVSECYDQEKADKLYKELAPYLYPQVSSH